MQYYNIVLNFMIEKKTKKSNIPNTYSHLYVLISFTIADACACVGGSYGYVFYRIVFTM